jgi:hypothetical protein
MDDGRARRHLRVPHVRVCVACCALHIMQKHYNAKKQTNKQTNEQTTKRTPHSTNANIKIETTNQQNKQNKTKTQLTKSAHAHAFVIVQERSNLVTLHYNN